MLIFNEETACSTYPFKYDEKIVWFPNNFLRNVARLPQKQTEPGLSLPDFFIGIDVDLVPSPNFVAQLSNFISAAPEKKSTLYLIVVFEAKNQDVISTIQDRDIFRACISRHVTYTRVAKMPQNGCDRDRSLA